LRKNLNIDYKSIDITTYPFIAFYNYTSDLLMTCNNLLNLSIY